MCRSPSHRARALSGRGQDAGLPHSRAAPARRRAAGSIARRATTSWRAPCGRAASARRGLRASALPAATRPRTAAAGTPAPPLPAPPGLPLQALHDHRLQVRGQTPAGGRPARERRHLALQQLQQHLRFRRRRTAAGRTAARRASLPTPTRPRAGPPPTPGPARAPCSGPIPRPGRSASQGAPRCRAPRRSPPRMDAGGRPRPA
jgi:hypothetical protein